MTGGSLGKSPVQGSEFGGQFGFGMPGAPGAISPFDFGQFQTALQNATNATTNRYQQLGLGAGSARPSGPTTGAVAGVPGSGTTPTAGGNFGAGSTAYNMDIGQNNQFAPPGSPGAPSLTGGLSEEALAGLGQLQTQDLSLTSQIAQGTNQGKSGGKGGGKGGLGAIGSLAKLGGK